MQSGLELEIIYGTVATKLSTIGINDAIKVMRLEILL
jgi:hypothetical protein